MRPSAQITPAVRSSGSHPGTQFLSPSGENNGKTFATGPFRRIRPLNIEARGMKDTLFLLRATAHAADLSETSQRVG